MGLPAYGGPTNLWQGGSQGGWDRAELLQTTPLDLTGSNRRFGGGRNDGWDRAELLQTTPLDLTASNRRFRGGRNDGWDQSRGFLAHLVPRGTVFMLE